MYTKTHAIIENRNWDNEPLKLCFIGSENECFQWVLKNTPFSNTEAYNNQGYLLLKIERGTFNSANLN